MEKLIITPASALRRLLSPYFVFSLSFFLLIVFTWMIMFSPSKSFRHTVDESNLWLQGKKEKQQSVVNDTSNSNLVVIPRNDQAGDSSNAGIPWDQAVPPQTLDTKPLTPLPGEQLFSKWIVVTSIQLPTKDVKLLGDLSRRGWRVLVVGDKSSPSVWPAPEGVRYLSYGEANDLGYNLLAHQRWKTYSVKNIGYLFAIQHGAEVIYDTDDDNHPTDKLLSFLLLAGLQHANDSLESGREVKKHNRVLIFKPMPGDYSLPVINTLPHFGQSSLWPRGFPLTEISRPPPRNYQLCSTQAPSWIQGVVNGDPDMDAIFRLTRKHFNTPINLTFDRSPPVVVPEKFFVQSNSQNTFFTYDALPLMFLPSGPNITMRETDIWRGYIGQPLLWLSGARKGYIAPNAFQARNAHSYLKDFTDEINVYKFAGQLISLLANWQCPASFDLGECFVKVYEDIALKNIVVSQFDSAAAAAWISDLRRMGFRFPKRKSTDDCLDPGGARLVQFYPIEQPLPLPAKPLLSRPSPMNLENEQTNLKKPDQYKCSVPTKQNFQVLNSSSVALVIFISTMPNESLKLLLGRLNNIYRPFVARRIFCLDSFSIAADDIMSFAKSKQLTVVESKGSSRAGFTIDCLKQVSGLGLDSTVFAYISVTDIRPTLLSPSGLQAAVNLSLRASTPSLDNNLLIGACDNNSVPAAVIIFQKVVATYNNFNEAQLHRLCSRGNGRNGTASFSKKKSTFFLSTQECSTSPDMPENDHVGSVLLKCDMISATSWPSPFCLNF